MALVTTQTVMVLKMKNKNNAGKDEEWNNFIKRVEHHALTGQVSLDSANWWLKECSDVLKKLEDLEDSQNDPGLLWDEKEKIQQKINELIMILVEIDRRMKLDQDQLLKEMQENKNLWDELEKLDSKRKRRST